MGWRTPLVDDLVRRLPDNYAAVLRLRADGADDGRIAEHLGVPIEVMPLLVEIAERKLRRLASTSGGPSRM